MRKPTRLTSFEVDRSRARLANEAPRGKRARGMSAMVERFMRSPFGLAKRPLSKTTPPGADGERATRDAGEARDTGDTGTRLRDRHKITRELARELTQNPTVETPLPALSPLLDSGTFLAAPRVDDHAIDGEAGDLANEESQITVRADVERAWVTLVVYGWHNVDPGPLSWVFPNFDAAICAVRAMRNAVKWAIVAGERETSLVDVDEERRSGQVLLEE